MLSLLVSIIALGLIITIHELGHFLVAKACGVGVIEFSLGMGPRLFTMVKGQTRYSFRVFPFGGSCMMLGEELEETEGNTASSELTNGTLEHQTVHVSEDELMVDGRVYSKASQFVKKAAWQRFLIILAGPMCNFILAFLLSLVITGAYGFDRPVITEVTAGMPAAEAGIEAGDEICKLRVGHTSGGVDCARDISIFMTVHQDSMEAAETFTVGFLDASDGMKKKEAVVTPVWDEENKTNRLGFSYSLAYHPVDGVGEIVKYSFYNVKYCIRSVIESLRMIGKGRVGREDVMGPVRMVAVMDESVDEAADYGAAAALVTLLDIMILISGSLGCMNLLPLPALDGGRLVFILIEMLTGHAVPKRLESSVHMAGMLLLLMLMFFILTNDITMLIFK